MARYTTTYWAQAVRVLLDVARDLRRGQAVCDDAYSPFATTVHGALSEASSILIDVDVRPWRGSPLLVLEEFWKSFVAENSPLDWGQLQSIWDALQPVFPIVFSEVPALRDAVVELEEIETDIEGRKAIERALASGLAVMDETPVHANTETSGTDAELSTADKAIAYLAADQGCTIAEIAAKLGVHRSTLYRYGKFMAAWKHVQKGDEWIPHGSKGDDGQVEASSR